MRLQLNQLVASPYESSLDHVLDSISLLDLRLLNEVQRMRQKNAEQIGSEEFQGLLVSEQEIDAILAGLPVVNEVSQVDSSPLSELIQKRSDEIALRVESSIDACVSLRLRTLQDLFGLNEFEANVVTICIAPELDLKYQKLFSYIQDDVSAMRPTVNVAMQLLCSELSERISRRTSFENGSPLVANEIVFMGDESYGKNSSLLNHHLGLNPRIAGYLFESERMDSELDLFGRLVMPSVTWTEVIFPQEFKSRLLATDAMLRDSHKDSSQVVVQFVGDAGTGKKTIAEAICHSLEQKLLIIDCAGMIESELPAGKLTTVVFNEALLQDAVLYLGNFHVLLEEGSRQKTLLTHLVRAFENRRGLTIVGAESAWRPESEIRDHAFITLEIPYPDYSERRQLWELQLNGHRGDVTSDDLSNIAAKFRLRGGQIRRVIDTASDRAHFSSEARRDLSVGDLAAASRWHSSRQLSGLAHKIDPRYGWDDIVLPDDQKTQLREMCNQFDNMALVYGEWGFQSKTNLGKGLNALFAGPSGTGKTMAADIMSGELGLDLYKIDLSGIVSKYIGETEKNLDRIFSEARDSNAILFFDEADALFGKRSEVRDSHDRYANIEISYLLQKVEEYQGIVILATNFRKNMDDAFLRRMHFVLEFPVPEEPDRLEIWKRVFPEGAPIKDEVDLGFIAKQFKIAGGNIKNIAVSSAFFAAQERQPIGMEHVILATRREYQKMGKLLVETDFAEYFSLVKS